MKYLSPKKGFLGIDAEQSIAPQVIVVPFGLEKTVSYGGGTKNGPREIINSMKTVQSQSTSNPCSISQIILYSTQLFYIDLRIFLLIDRRTNKFVEHT